MRGRKSYKRLEDGTFAPGIMCKNGHLLSETAYFSRKVPRRWSCRKCRDIWNEKNKDRISKMRRKWRVNNNEKERAAAQKRYDKDPERHRQTARDYYIKAKPLIRKKAIEKLYNITKDELDKMFKDQGECCAICGTKDFFKRVPTVDHCHITKKVRGLLCFNCNAGLGNFKDRLDLVERAVDYLNNNS